MTSPKPDTYLLVIEPAGGRQYVAPPIQRLKLLSKAILRAYGFRIVKIEPIKSYETCRTVH